MKNPLSRALQHERTQNQLRLNKAWINDPAYSSCCTWRFIMEMTRKKNLTLISQDYSEVSEKASTPVWSQHHSVSTHLLCRLHTALYSCIISQTSMTIAQDNVEVWLRSRFRVTGNMGFTFCSVFDCIPTKGHMINRMTNIG